MVKDFFYVKINQPYFNIVKVVFFLIIKGAIIIDLENYIDDFFQSRLFIHIPEECKEYAPSLLQLFVQKVHVDIKESWIVADFEKILVESFSRMALSVEVKRSIPALIEQFFEFLVVSGNFPPAQNWKADFTVASKKYLARLKEDGTIRGETFQKKYTDVGRNDDCPCGSGKKFKKCCMKLIGG